MSRYIDADALIERIKVHAKNVKSGSRYSDDIYELAHEHIVELVEMQPTAYDPDAVVKQLEDWLNATGCIPKGTSYYHELLSIVRNAGKDGAE